ncbi:MAG: hypothetical protein CRN43_15995 [Candidatus Nephrothrix sp. EaCA]|nr:MAG: hypothetical protein CRN43_15995 [Candidatus Nephrothrix sp. EaCA]
MGVKPASSGGVFRIRDSDIIDSVSVYIIKIIEIRILCIAVVGAVTAAILLLIFGQGLFIDCAYCII